MKKGLLKAGVLLLLFAAALGGTAALINREKIVGTRQMEDASLPILYMEVADTKVNPMYGYAGEMEEQYMRDSLTPLPTDRSLTMAIDPKNASVKTVSYRVSTADGTEVVETSKISKLKKKDGEIRAEFQLETPILMNQEYTLRFDVTLDNGETYYYYTRLLQRAGTNISEYLEFADSFYQTCLDPENASTLAAYLEPDETQTNSTYENLNIHSSFERITWGTLDMKLEKKAVPVIKDMNETTCSIYLTYVLSDTPEDETTDYYNVTDFYRMRYAQSRVMLLDFDRNTQELYDGKHTELTSKGSIWELWPKMFSISLIKVRILWHLFRKESCGVITAVPIRQHRFSVSGMVIWMSGRTCRNMELRSSGWKNPEILICCIRLYEPGCT